MNGRRTSGPVEPSGAGASELLAKGTASVRSTGGERSRRRHGPEAEEATGSSSGPAARTRARTAPGGVEEEA